MVCSKCGMKINEGEQVCPNCKNNLGIVSYEFDTSTSVKPKSKKKITVAVIIVCLGVMLSVLSVIHIINNDKKSDNLISDENTTSEDDVTISEDVENNELIDVDVFKDVYIKIDEKDGLCKLSCIYFGEDDILIGDDVECIPSKGLKYGDSFFLTYDMESAEFLREYCGMNPITTKKELVLLKPEESGLTDISDVSDDFMTKLVKKDLSNICRGTVEGMNINNCEYVGSFMYSFDETDESMFDNCIVLMYKVNKCTYSGKIINTDVYAWGMYFDIFEDPYGSQMYLGDKIEHGHPDMTYNKEIGTYDDLTIEDVINDVKERYQMKEENISYDLK